MARFIRKNWFHLGLIVVFAIVVGILAFPKEDALLGQLGLNTDLSVRRGLDLQGGAYLIYRADMSKLGEEANPQEVLDNLVTAIRKRVDPSGTSEVSIQTAANNRIVVQIPGVQDIEQAKELIGRTAQLSFYEVSATQGQAGQPQLKPTPISGEDVKEATLSIDPQTSQPVVNLQFKSGQSTKEWADLTTRLSNSGKMLVTFLGQQRIFGPAQVSQPLTNGQATLTGQFTTEEADEIATLLNAGALPVPVEGPITERTIGPTLGEVAINRSVMAAAIGLVSIGLFLIAYYRLSGLMAVLELGIYTATTLAVYKLSTFTDFSITLTLAGIAGFILSIAMAADANILIVERMKEEIVGGRSIRAGFETGFKRAWTSIRDANVATIIASFILYQSGTPLVKGFAVTLGVGVVISLLAAVTITKVFMRSLVRTPAGRKLWWLGIAKTELEDAK